MGYANRRARQGALAFVTLTVVPAVTFGAWASTFPLGIELHWLKPVPPDVGGALNLFGVSALWAFLLGLYAWVSGWVVLFLLMALVMLIDEWEKARTVVLDDRLLVDDRYDMIVIAWLWLVGATQVGLTIAVLVAGLWRGWLWGLAVTWAVLIGLAMLMLAGHAGPDGN